MNREEIRDSVTIFDLCKRYGIKVKNNTIRCPFHNDNHPSCSIYNNGKKFHCFSCGESGDVFKFVMNMEDIPFYKAFKLLGGEDKSFNKYKFEERKRKIRANEILVTLDIILFEDEIRKKSKPLKKLEKRIFKAYPNMKQKPCWTDYLDYTGNEHLKTIPALIAPYVYLQRYVDKCYEDLDERVKEYKHMGYRVDSGKGFDKVYPLICEYKTLCYSKAANLDNLNKVILNHKKRSDFYFKN